MPFLLDALAGIGLLIALQTLWQWKRNWRQFWDEHVSREDLQLAQRLALFLLVPIGVLLHEVGHSLAIWHVGGVVSTFQWRYLWGFVIPQGHFSPLQTWWIALSGNLVSLLLAGLALLWIPRVRRRILAELLMAFAITQAVLSLVSYPLFSLATRWGDWARIYDVSQPLQATLTLLIHGLLLLGLWRLYHSQPALQWRLEREPAIANQWREMKRATDQDPAAIPDRLALVDLLLRQGEPLEARCVMRGFPPDAAQDGKVELRRMALAAALHSPRRALRLGKSLLVEDLPPGDRVRLEALLSHCHLRLGQLSTALAHANHGLTLEPTNGQLLSMRAWIHRQLHNTVEAEADWELALGQASTAERRQELHRLQQRMQRQLRTRTYPLTQWLWFGLGCTPLIGLPLALGGILWGAIRLRKDGRRWILLGVLAMVMNVIFFFLLMIMIPILFNLLPKDNRTMKELNQRDVQVAAELVESYKSRKGFYPDSLSDLAATPGYYVLFDATMPAKSDSLNTTYEERPLYVYQPTADGSGYLLFGRGPDRKPYTADDVWPSRRAPLPGLQHPAKVAP